MVQPGQRVVGRDPRKVHLGQRRSPDHSGQEARSDAVAAQPSDAAERFAAADRARYGLVGVRGEGYAPWSATLMVETALRKGTRGLARGDATQISVSPPAGG